MEKLFDYARLITREAQNYESEVSAIASALGLQRSAVENYLQSHTIDIKTLRSVVFCTGRLPTSEDIRNIRLLGLNMFLEYSRLLI